MKTILAADIGGTCSRFAVFTVTTEGLSRTSAVFTFPTRQDGINSFSDFLKHYRNYRPENFPGLEDIENIALAVPGPVRGNRCTLPNIDWDIDLDEVSCSNITLLNDFTAQGFACLLPDVIARLLPVKPGMAIDAGNIAVIGAGTGLGHCCLAHDGDSYFPIPSESGYSTFAFRGQTEKRFEEFLLSKTGRPYIVNDHVVSGSGLAHLHEFLTGRRCAAEEVFTDNNNEETLALFSRFYGRTCRNYCLTAMITGSLIISGGLAIKHPELITCKNFMDEFLASAAPAYDALLGELPVWLNPDENIGLLGAASYASRYEGAD